MPSCRYWDRAGAAMSGLAQFEFEDFAYDPFVDVDLEFAVEELPYEPLADEDMFEDSDAGQWWRTAERGLNLALRYQQARQAQELRQAQTRLPAPLRAPALAPAGSIGQFVRDHPLIAAAGAGVIAFLIFR